MITNIIPSKPFENYADIAFLAAKAKGKVERIQVDICDGEYVKNVSWPFTETSKNDFAKMYQKKELDVFMPEWEDLNYTADLMCIHPEKYIDTLAAYGFDGAGGPLPVRMRGDRHRRYRRGRHNNGCRRCGGCGRRSDQYGGGCGHVIQNGKAGLLQG